MDAGRADRLRRRPGGAPFVGADGGTAPVAAFARRDVDGGAELDDLLLELAAGFGRRHWWPAASPFEVAVGAVLTQNTAWRNVELALANLRVAGVLGGEDEPLALSELAALQAAPDPARGPGAVSSSTTVEPSCEPPAPSAPGPPDATPAPPTPLEAAIRPAGFFRGKARKLAALTAWWRAAPGGGAAALAGRTLAPLRAELLAIHGVGPETADCLLAYAGGRPVAVVDAYTRRILARHGLVPHAARAPYDELRAWLEARLLPEQLVLEEFHALCVAAGAGHCKPSPRCATCPATDPPPAPPAG